MIDQLSRTNEKLFSSSTGLQAIQYNTNSKKSLLNYSKAYIFIFTFGKKYYIHLYSLLNIYDQLTSWLLNK
jgi:hypothetical protein